ncbi:hypothetical protein BN3661_01821 [Eubacteriaceae bacterium CHKCI005]|nr:hypothetical protein BN3661_01821 [Eubacteriaceae bacterium CHKCI005]
MKINKYINGKGIIVLLILVICSVIFYYQTQKIGFHEDEVYSILLAVNPDNGLMMPYDSDILTEHNNPVWKTREYVTDFMTLAKDNYFNLGAIYHNQAIDNHPPFFYLLVHGSAMLLGGGFTKYCVFLVNLLAFLGSCFVITRILKLLGKSNLTAAVLILYGLSMGTISMVLYQRMYMTLTLFILLYFYHSIGLYQSGFAWNKKRTVWLGIVTVLGFLTQYFFAIFAAVLFLILLVKMIQEKKWISVRKYIISHVLYGAAGILLFPPCIDHLLNSDRGLSNLANSNYWSNFLAYLKHLAYSFTVSESLFYLAAILFLALIVTALWRTSSEKRFVLLLMILPGIVFFLVTVKLTSFQELRYIMPVLPFIVMTLFYGADELLHLKYQSVIMTAVSILLVINGMVWSKPKFLYEDYRACLEIAQQNKEKSFVFINDNYFTHMRSIPEMMIYQKTLILNAAWNELDHLIYNQELNQEDSYILCIKAYMDNDKILQEIKHRTSFHTIKTLFTSNSGASDELVENNLYLVSK